MEGSTVIIEQMWPEQPFFFFYVFYCHAQKRAL